MSNKTNLKSKVLNVVTLGYVNRKAKEISTQTSEQIQGSKEIGVNVNDLIKFLGGIENIIEISATLTTLKIVFKNKTLIKNEEIKKMGAKGIILSETYISIVFGDWAKELASQILIVKKRGGRNV